MARLLYCSIKEIYRANRNYYTTGSWPEFIPSLADYFDETYLMVPVLTTTPEELKKLSKFKDNKNLRFTSARDAPFRWNLPLWSLANLNLFRKLQKRADVTLMAIPSSIPYLAYLPLKNKPLIAYIAGDEQEVIKALNPSFLKRAGYSRIAKSAERYLLERADVIICRNHKFKRNLVAQYHLKETNIHVITSGIDIDAFKPFQSNQKAATRNELKLGDSPVIGFVSQAISVSKGGDNVIKVFKETKKGMPAVRLLLIGEDRIGIPQDDSIIHHGFVRREGMPIYYNAMDIFLLPSRSEGAPKVVMEACACGIPVIATNVGGIPELIKEGHTGFTVDPENVEGMINYCRSLLHNESLRIEMGRKARDYAVEHFDSDKLVKKTAEAIKSIVVRK